LDFGESFAFLMLVDWDVELDVVNVLLSFEARGIPETMKIYPQIVMSKIFCKRIAVGVRKSRGKTAVVAS